MIDSIYREGNFSGILGGFRSKKWNYEGVAGSFRPNDAGRNDYIKGEEKNESSRILSPQNSVP
jgi:hypothetical protein